MAKQLHKWGLGVFKTTMNQLSELGKAASYAINN